MWPASNSPNRVKTYVAAEGGETTDREADEFWRIKKIPQGKEKKARIQREKENKGAKAPLTQMTPKQE